MNIKEIFKKHQVQEPDFQKIWLHANEATIKKRKWTIKSLWFTLSSVFVFLLFSLIIFMQIAEQEKPSDQNENNRPATNLVIKNTFLQDQAISIEFEINTETYPLITENSTGNLPPPFMPQLTINWADDSKQYNYIGLQITALENNWAQVKALYHIGEDLEALTNENINGLLQIVDRENSPHEGTKFSLQVDVNSLVDRSSNKEQRTISDEDRSTVIQLAQQTFTQLLDHQYEEIADIIHPEYHLTFTNNANFAVNRFGGATLSEEDLREDGEHIQYYWGNNGQSDFKVIEPLEKFVDEHLFSRQGTAYQYKDDLVFNTIRHTGGLLNTIHDYHPNAVFVDFDADGFGEFADTNWQRLRFVFEEYEETWYLFGIVKESHNP